jgi:predicted alpha/beta hydrolase family esterase
LPIPVLFLHSSGPQGPGEGSEPLARRLREELGPDYEVVFPEMPDSATDPHYEPWRDRLASELEALEGKVIVFGHSLGGSVALKYCAERGFDERVAGLIVVAAPFWGTGQDWEREWALPEGWPEEGPSLPPTTLFHSSDDEVSPFPHLDLYAKKLPDVTVRPLEGYGHLYERGDLSPIRDAVRSL